MTERAGGPADPASEDRPELGGPDVVGSFGPLYDRYARELHRYLRRRVGQVADDLVAETFVVAMQHRQDYSPDRGTARSWLYGIATNLLRGHVREEARTLRTAAKMVGEAQQNADPPDTRVPDQVDARDQVTRLTAALAEIDPGNRDALLLTTWAGMDASEVAEALSIPVATVRTRLHRGRRQLRAELAANRRPRRTGEGSLGDE
ncbi:RNA polymerase subunit sigma-70 [Amycolatopsis antarctica]|uniref:RNA polymerase subunit sigma-70 n=1 Tax=Amycolatopsis antarctica TaxID=1854586 RepID=A0A263CZI7_9PSEU|nr:RNA polymerase sigma factor [Amycolatopsis antarctica]OZM71521.1 RNA polymerase subunit sigma-70 [Amycolatopsis antarctica]